MPITCLLLLISGEPDEPFLVSQLCSNSVLFIFEIDPAEVQISPLSSSSSGYPAEKILIFLY